ncbi:histidine phosphatase family protein [Aeromicrobium sp.]|uniref:histidine phosphatase family protein n=1 Tax=Aeromicrobium sp. TaxID=1871063 RepID=UPI0019930DCB|nr:histidine phosphatase family protein [Aeromicrobium sp.]MBC7630116.1 histidine phosphatase family protein [Aeromicrobium sp.]
MGSVHLIRHGQASWGSDDYDQLSPLGMQQSASLGISWEASEWAPTVAVAGSLKRHAQTAIATIDACGQGDGYDIDAGWDEFDHISLARAHDPAALTTDPKDFQALLNTAIDSWIAGEGGVEGETYQAFVDRVMGAFGAVVPQAGPGRTVAVFTSGGPIAMVASHLLTGDDSLFQRINDVIVNASVTTIITGRSGPRLLTLNEHTHLMRDLVTFR